MYIPDSKNRNRLNFDLPPLDLNTKPPMFAGLGRMLASKLIPGANMDPIYVRRRRTVVVTVGFALAAFGLMSQATPEKEDTVTPLCIVTTPGTFVYTAVPADFASSIYSPKTEILINIPGVSNGTCIKTAGIIARGLNGDTIDNPQVGESFNLPTGLAPAPIPTSNG